VKFLRTVRLDDSDERVFERAAEPGEWAVPGSFAFIDVDPAALAGKALQAFRIGFLGTRSFGWSTLVEIVDIEDDDFQAVIDRLAARFMAACGAPHLAAALAQATEEAGQVAAMCDGTPHTLLAIERTLNDEGVADRLRRVDPSGAGHDGLRLWKMTAE